VKDFQHLRWNADGPIGKLWLNRPPVNAVDLAFYGEIQYFFSNLTEFLPEARALVVTGQGKHFCAGNDLADFQTMTPDNAAERMREIRQAFFALYDAPIPVIAAVHGVAAGTGVAIAASCDMVIAAKGARFALPEINVGVMGGAKHLSRLVPQAMVRYLHYTGDFVSAERLLPYGGILEIVPEANLMASAEALAASIARHSPLMIHFAKRSLNAIEYMDLKQGYEFEQSLSIALSDRPDAKEALAASIDRRAPIYTADLSGAVEFFEREITTPNGHRKAPVATGTVDRR
jgi:enoyl-CoA hydratase